MGLFDKFFGKKKEERHQGSKEKPRIAQPAPLSDSEFEIRRIQLDEFRAQLDEYRNQLETMMENLASADQPDEENIRQRELLEQRFMDLQNKYLELQERSKDLDRMRG